MTIDAALLERHGLKPDEYDRIVKALGREPSITELGIFSVMWSEHCSYKSSRIHLKKLPTRGPRVLQGPGENAGAVDIGDGLAAVFKIESHNHPSFIEPYQGAATGVGGIIRDIFTMGARPIALLNSLRFGPLDGPTGARTRRIVEGVVAGIGGYGNSIGIATVGGEIAFEEPYAGNPLVNVMCLGIVNADALVKGKASGVGNPVYYVGAKTGRDGIHGATMASAEFDDRSAEKRPAVQVGDPFMEKLLLEACLELMATDALIGVQDMGAAGLDLLDLRNGRARRRRHRDRRPARPAAGNRDVALRDHALRIAGAHAARRQARTRARGRGDLREVGSPRRAHRRRHRRRADAGEVPRARSWRRFRTPRWWTRRPSTIGRPRVRPTWTRSGKLDLDALRPAPPTDALLTLLAAPTIASKRWVYRQYDHMVRTNTLVLAGMGAGVVRIKGTPRALAMSTDGNGRHCYLDPRKGAMLAVAEAARNVACAGGRPIGATNCLNFGNPEKPEIMWQLVEAVEGIAEACRALDVPITGGNVSLYNETDGNAIYPTPIIGVVGVIEDAACTLGRVFRQPGRRHRAARGSRRQPGRQRVPQDRSRPGRGRASRGSIWRASER